MSDLERQLGDTARSVVPVVVASLARWCGDFESAEEAVQEALVAALRQWPTEGVPASPAAWLTTVAKRRVIDHQRSERARAAREVVVASDRSHDDVESRPASTDDDALVLITLSCHPALSRPSQVALTLRAVGGLTTAQIARNFLVSEATMAQRISRAKARLVEIGARFELPAEADLADRVASVLAVLYVIYTEGHTSTHGSRITDVQLTTEAIRLTRQLLDALPDHAEAAGLLALMVLTEARRPARTSADGALVLLADQDRSRWDLDAIQRGVELVERTLRLGRVGPFQVQAAIAAIHCEAPTAADTDWPQIVVLYGILEQLTPTSTVRLNRAVAVAMVDGPEAGLHLLEPLREDPTMRRSHRLHAARARLLEQGGDRVAARAEYLLGARHATNIPEQRHLLDCANALE